MSHAIVVNQAQPILSVTEKVKQMCWTRRGVNLLRQIRCAAVNGKLGFGAGQLFKANPGSEMAIAA